MKSKRYHSHATSPGIAIAPAYCLKRTTLAPPRYWILDRDVEQEVQRFVTALKRSREQLVRIEGKMCRIQGYDQLKIIESQRLFLQDDMLTKSTIETIREGRINAEWALDKILTQLKLNFLNVAEGHFRDRYQDIGYAGRRVMDNLLGGGGLSASELPEGECIIFVHDLSPAEVANFPRHRVAGIVMEMGGETSHTAIIARALAIPAVLGVKDVLDHVTDEEIVIVDGVKGLVVLSPQKAELIQYRTIRQKYADLERLLMQDIHLPAKTRDGFTIHLEANIELLDEIPSLLQHGAEGVGLYRTEYLFLNRLDFPSEQEQFDNYRTVLSRLGSRVVTIRTLDLGGDKIAFGQQEYEEQANPALGLRAIRLCLRERSLLVAQLRALLRASPFGNLRILIPLVSQIDEVRQVMTILANVKKDLKKEKIPFRNNVPVGVMIEVPSAAIMAAEFARLVDFFSIGTNDLLQYGLAIDRSNELVSHFFSPYEPAIIRLVHATVAAARKARIPVTVCGEMAGDPLAIAFLLGLDLDALSMNPVSIPRAKKIIRSLDRRQSRKILKEVLLMSTAHDVERHLRKRLPKLHLDRHVLFSL